MKNILALVIVLFAASPSFASEYYDLNLTNPRDLQNMTFSLYTLCGKNVTCKGVEVTIPTGSRVAVESQNGAACSIQRSSSLQFKGGDSYIVDVELEADNQSCDLTIKPKNKKSVVVQLTNESAAL